MPNKKMVFNLILFFTLTIFTICYLWFFAQFISGKNTSIITILFFTVIYLVFVLYPIFLGVKFGFKNEKLAFFLRKLFLSGIFLLAYVAWNWLKSGNHFLNLFLIIVFSIILFKIDSMLDNFFKLPV